MEELQKELEERETAEISNGVVNQVTQALDESDAKVKYLIFGEQVEQGIIPIDQACAACDHCHFDTVELCRDKQSKDARVRGFNEIICPKQMDR